MGGYNKNQAVVYNIQPKNRSIDAVMSFSQSGESKLIHILININNNSTLDIKKLQLYLVNQGKTINEAEQPIWEYHDTIKCDGTTQQIVAYDIQPLEEQESVFYLTDENKYVISELRMQLDSKINDVQQRDSKWNRIYDMHGKVIKEPVKGVSIVDMGSVKKKIIIKN